MTPVILDGFSPFETSGNPSFSQKSVETSVLSDESEGANIKSVTHSPVPSVESLSATIISHG